MRPANDDHKGAPYCSLSADEQGACTREEPLSRDLEAWELAELGDDRRRTRSAAGICKSCSRYLQRRVEARKVAPTKCSRCKVNSPADQFRWWKKGCGSDRRVCLRCTKQLGIEHKAAEAARVKAGKGKGKGKQRGRPADVVPVGRHQKWRDLCELGSACADGECECDHLDGWLAVDAGVLADVLSRPCTEERCAGHVAPCAVVRGHALNGAFRMKCTGCGAAADPVVCQRPIKGRTEPRSSPRRQPPTPTTGSSTGMRAAARRNLIPATVAEAADTAHAGAATAAADAADAGPATKRGHFVIGGGSTQAEELAPVTAAERKVQLRAGRLANVLLHSSTHCGLKTATLQQMLEPIGCNLPEKSSCAQLHLRTNVLVAQELVQKAFEESVAVHGGKLEVSGDGCHQQVFNSSHGSVILADASSPTLSALMVVVMSRNVDTAAARRGLQQFQESAKVMEAKGMTAGLTQLHQAGATISHFTTDGDLSMPKIIKMVMAKEPNSNPDYRHMLDKNHYFKSLRTFVHQIMKDPKMMAEHGRPHELGGCQDWCSHCEKTTGTGKCKDVATYNIHRLNKAYVTGNRKCCSQANDSFERDELRRGLATAFAVLECMVEEKKLTAAEFKAKYREYITRVLQHCFNIHDLCDPAVCSHHPHTELTPPHKRPAFVTCGATQIRLTEMLKTFFSDAQLDKLVDADNNLSNPGTQKNESYNSVLARYAQKGTFMSATQYLTMVAAAVVRVQESAIASRWHDTVVAAAETAIATEAAVAKETAAAADDGAAPAPTTAAAAAADPAVNATAVAAAAADATANATTVTATTGTTATTTTTTAAAAAAPTATGSGLQTDIAAKARKLKRKRAHASAAKAEPYQETLRITKLLKCAERELEYADGELEIPRGASFLVRRRLLNRVKANANKRTDEAKIQKSTARFRARDSRPAVSDADEYRTGSGTGLSIYAPLRPTNSKARAPRASTAGVAPTKDSQEALDYLLHDRGGPNAPVWRELGMTVYAPTKQKNWKGTKLHRLYPAALGRAKLATLHVDILAMLDPPEADPDEADPDTDQGAQ